MIRLATCFSGIGAIEHALNRMGLDNRIVFASDMAISIFFLKISLLIYKIYKMNLMSLKKL